MSWDDAEDETVAEFKRQTKAEMDALYHGVFEAHHNEDEDVVGRAFRDALDGIGATYTDAEISALAREVSAGHEVFFEFE